MESAQITTTHTGVQALPGREVLLHHMATKGFWTLFFAYYQKTVHPAEYAVIGQKEQALSAAFQRTLFLNQEALGLNLWVPVLEAPIEAERGGTAYCDITLIPWDRSLQEASWNAVKDPDKHVRIEVKWRDMSFSGSADAAEIFQTASSNESKQHFSLNLIFHGDRKQPALGQDLSTWPWHDRWEPLFLQSALRSGAAFDPAYSTHTLVVLKNKKWCAQGAK